MIFSKLLLLFALAAFSQSTFLTRLETKLSASTLARKLLTVTSTVDRVETHESGMPLAIDVRQQFKPEIVIDLNRLTALPVGEAEAEYARALAETAIGSPIELVEAEQAIRQWTGQILLECAVENKELLVPLKKAEKTQQEQSPILNQAMSFVLSFERKPAQAYWEIEMSQKAKGAYTFNELEDLFLAHSVEIFAIKETPADPYGQLGNRRYPAPLLRAAMKLRQAGAIDRLREALASFDTVGINSFQTAILRWRHAGVH